jgi:hypothetical protein
MADRRPLVLVARGARNLRASRRRPPGRILAEACERIAQRHGVELGRSDGER